MNEFSCFWSLTSFRAWRVHLASKDAARSSNVTKAEPVFNGTSCLEQHLDWWPTLPGKWGRTGSASRQPSFDGQAVRLSDMVTMYIICKLPNPMIPLRFSIYFCGLSASHNCLALFFQTDFFKIFPFELVICFELLMKLHVTNEQNHWKGHRMFVLFVFASFMNKQKHWWLWDKINIAV